MSEIKRYSIPSIQASLDDGTLFVVDSDYAKLEAERDALREENDALRLKVQQCSYLPVWWKSAEELQKELAALRK